MACSSRWRAGDARHCAGFAHAWHAMHISCHSPLFFALSTCLAVSRIHIKVIAASQHQRLAGLARGKCRLGSSTVERNLAGERYHSHASCGVVVAIPLLGMPGTRHGSPAIIFAARSLGPLSSGLQLHRLSFSCLFPRLNTPAAAGPIECLRKRYFTLTRDNSLRLTPIDSPIKLSGSQPLTLGQVRSTISHSEHWVTGSYASNPGIRAFSGSRPK